MKGRFFSIIAVVVLATNVLIAQDYSKLDNIVLKDKADYAKYEDLVLECANYLLSQPVESLDKDLNTLKALQFLMRWMEGTPDYMFSLDESIGEVAKSNNALFGIYMACMTKFVIENRDKSEDQNEIKYNSFITFITYCEDPARNVKQSKAIKELIKARNENTLRNYLKIPNTLQQI